jgi:hypothetical protein
MTSDVFIGNFFLCGECLTVLGKNNLIVQYMSGTFKYETVHLEYSTNLQSSDETFIAGRICGRCQVKVSAMQLCRIEKNSALLSKRCHFPASKSILLFARFPTAVRSLYKGQHVPTDRKQQKNPCNKSYISVYLGVLVQLFSNSSAIRPLIMYK